MERIMFKVGSDYFINDSNFSFVGRSKIDGEPIYYVDFYNEMEARVRDLKSRRLKQKLLEKDITDRTLRDYEYDMRVNVFDDIKEYLRDEYKVEKVSKIVSIIDHMPFL